MLCRHFRRSLTRPVLLQNLIHRKSSGCAGGLLKFDSSGSVGGGEWSRWVERCDCFGACKQCSEVVGPRTQKTKEDANELDFAGGRTKKYSRWIGERRRIIARRAMRPWAAPPPSSLRLCRRSLTSLLNALPRLLNTRPHLIIFIPLNPELVLELSANIIAHAARPRFNCFRIEIAMEFIRSTG